MILRCWYIDEWMQLVDKLGQQEAVMVVIINKVATRQGLWQASIGRHLNLLRDPHCPTVQFGQSEKSPTSLPTPYMKERSNVKQLGTQLMSPDLTNGPELTWELLLRLQRETDHFTFSTFAQNIRSTDQIVVQWQWKCTSVQVCIAV